MRGHRASTPVGSGIRRFTATRGCPATVSSGAHSAMDSTHRITCMAAGSSTPATDSAVATTMAAMVTTAAMAIAEARTAESIRRSGMATAVEAASTVAVEVEVSTVVAAEAGANPHRMITVKRSPRTWGERSRFARAGRL